MRQLYCQYCQFHCSCCKVEYSIIYLVINSALCSDGVVTVTPSALSLSTRVKQTVRQSTPEFLTTTVWELWSHDQKNVVNKKVKCFVGMLRLQWFFFIISNTWLIKSMKRNEPYMWFNTPLSLRHGCDSFLFTIIITEEFLINNTTGDHIEPADNIIQ